VNQVPSLSENNFREQSLMKDHQNHLCYGHKL
jgi:hypothetical protein